MLTPRLRRTVLGVLDAFSLALLLFLLPLRLALWAFGRRTSYWTGDPIITLSLKAKCERLLGCDARSLVLSTYYVTKRFDIDLSRWSAMRLVRPFVPFAAFLYVCVTGKRVHAFYNHGVLPQRRNGQFNPIELTAYRLLGIELFLWAYGADVRTREATLRFGEPNCCTDCPAVGKACVCDTQRHETNYRALRRAATACFSMGDMTAYTPGSRNDLFYWPIDLDDEEGLRYAPSFPDPGDAKPLRVVHAPNHRAFKGTRYLEAAVEELRREGQPIELVMVEGVPNDEALAIYRSADVVFDQCLIGFHGYFALEAMALGKPVMCFIRDPRKFLLAPKECPIINTHVATLREDLRKLLRARKELPEIGQRSRRYIERHYTLSAFAQRLRGVYSDLGVAP